MLYIRNLKKHFDTQVIFEGANLQINEREKVALVGANGLGKTTVLKMILNEDTEYEGQIETLNNICIKTIEQEIPKTDMLLLDYVLSSFALKKQHDKIKQLEKLIHEEPENQDYLNEYSEELSLFEQNGGYEYIYEVKKILEGLGFPESEFNRPLSSFSGGEKRRALLANLLIQKPQMLILDEPTNHLDIKNTVFLENFLKNYPNTILFVSHDLEFINQISTHICEIENKNFKKYKGNFESYKEQKAAFIELQQKELSQLKEQYQKDFEFVSKFKAGTRSTQAASREKRMLKTKEQIDSIKIISENHRVFFQERESRAKAFTPALKVENLSKSFKDRLLFDKVSFQIEEGEKACLLGTNGSGKSTLFNLINNDLSLDSGLVSWNQNVFKGYFKQEDHNFNKELSCFEHLIKTFDLKYRDQEIKQYLAQLRLRFDTQIGSLSGGEKSKLKLLTLLLSDVNFLMLDEPTNHLDIYSIQAIIDIISIFKGTVFFISHDRHLLKTLNPLVFLLEDKTVTQIHDNNWDIIFQSLGNYNFNSNPKSTATKSISKGKASKEEQKRQNKLKRDIQKLEKHIEEMEKEKELLKEMQFSEDIYTNYEKAQEIEEKLKSLEENLEKDYKEWETLNHEVQNFSC